MLHLLSLNWFIYTFFIFIIFLTGYHIPCFKLYTKASKNARGNQDNPEIFLKKPERNVFHSFFLLRINEKILLPRNELLKNSCTFFVFSLTFVKVGVYCCLERISGYGIRLRVLYIWLFQQIARENPPSFLERFC